MRNYKRLISKIFAFIYLLKKINFINLLSSNSTKSDIVVWLKINPIMNIISYLRYNDLLSDLAIICALQKRDKKFRIVIGSQIVCINDKTIFYSISETCNPYNLADYSMSLYNTAKAIESQNNTLFPNVQSILLWENKGYMHRQFRDLNVNHPETIIFGRHDSLDKMTIPDFPFLVKEIHSAGSRGLHLVNSLKDLSEVVSKIFSKGHSELLIQKLVNMRKDLRLVLHRDKVVSYYWRINPDDKWKPTATSYGGFTKFDDLPAQWLDLFVEYLERLGLETAAFDIAWENDDISTYPLVLEVSPSYQLNPLLPDQYKNIPYKTWKGKLFIANAYHKEYVDVVLNNISRLVDSYLVQINR
jgi:glutathione synthase/RimK-type ligase-like ATP-grasp enzyme